MATKGSTAAAGSAPAKAAPKKRGKKAATGEEGVAAAAGAAPVGDAAEATVPAPLAAVPPAETAVREAAPPEPEPGPTPTRDEVARRAYEIWLARGGSAFANWVEAERQLSRR